MKDASLSISHHEDKPPLRFESAPCAPRKYIKGAPKIGIGLNLMQFEYFVFFTFSVRHFCWNNWKRSALRMILSVCATKDANCSNVDSGTSITLGPRMGTIVAVSNLKVRIRTISTNHVECLPNFLEMKTLSILRNHA